MKKDSVLMTAAELADYLGCTRNFAYNLMHRADFPSIQVGSSLYAVRDQVDVWVRRQAEEGGYTYEP